MALILIFRTVAHERDVSRTREFLNETQGEFLSMILDGAATFVDRPIHEQFGSVTSGESSP
jgi:hypothetical protein